MLNSTRTLLGHAKLARARILARAAHSLGISDHKKLQWVPIGAAQDVLLLQLEAMFWESVECELKEIIRTLRGWQAADLNDVELEDEANVEIYGFDTFIDQVSESSREFSVEYAKEKARSLRKTVKGEFVPSEHRLQALARQFCANNTSKRLKEEITESLKARPVEPDIWKRRARLLLQSAGWLDVDKFIQHRPPLEEVGFWKRPTPPQLSLDSLTPHHTPIFRPTTCSTPTCGRPIHGVTFHCTSTPCSAAHPPGPICQDCQHEPPRTTTTTVTNPNLADHHLSKQYKTSPLTPAAIPPATSRAICRCTTVARSDADGRLRAVFPVRRGVDRHRTAPAPCGLLALGDAVAEAKYLGVRGGQGKKGETLDEERRRAERALEAERALAAERARRGGGGKGVGAVGEEEVQFGTETINEKEADADIPWFLKKAAGRVPFGNVHVALRLGTLVVENGVQDSKGGVLMTRRQIPSWSLAGEVGTGGGERMLALSEDRTLWEETSRPQRPRRYKTALKQVVGGLFAGVCLEQLEEEIIGLVLAASRKGLDHDDDNAWQQRVRWRGVLGPIERKLHDLMDGRVARMLGSVVERLLDPGVKLRWDRQDNNCQMFCDALIDYSLYRGLVAATTVEGIPPYLMSFVCHPDGYRRERKVQTKHDVPSGLCEEYLLKFRFGFHLDSDIIDTLHEYWHDWGNFGGPLYPHQPMFPWDCTEAYGRSPVRCGNCNTAKHAWAFPFDSWSMAELHLTRGAVMYPRPATAGHGLTARATWMANRLAVLQVQDALIAGAKAMASSAGFQKETAWLAVNGDRRLDRLKLGGIHRAQPFSHQWEEGRYHEYFIADWAHLELGDKVAEYERQRELRMALPDVKVGSGGEGNEDEGSDWGDDGYWTDDFAFWAFAYFDPYYEDGWDGSYSREETMTANDLALLASAADVGPEGDNASSAGGSIHGGGWGDDGGDGGGGGGE